MKLDVERLLWLVLLVLVTACATDSPQQRRERPKTKPQPIRVPAGFVVDSIYSPSAHEQGSWVALAEAPNGVYYASDQFGKLYTFTMPEVGSR